MNLTFTKEKPTEPGAYWVRGYAIGKRHETALVEVREIGGMLHSNIHCCNSDPHETLYPVARHSKNIEWCGPLLPANAVLSGSRTKQQDERKP